MAPVMTKAYRQPYASVNQATSGAAMMAPAAAPAFTNPFAKAFSFGGYHSEIALNAAMKLPGSPTPRRKR